VLGQYILASDNSDGGKPVKKTRMIDTMIDTTIDSNSIQGKPCSSSCPLLSSMFLITAQCDPLKSCLKASAVLESFLLLQVCNLR
jgi:hypothetical protein